MRRFHHPYSYIYRGCDSDPLLFVQTLIEKSNQTPLKKNNPISPEPDCYKREKRIPLKPALWLQTTTSQKQNSSEGWI
jgi:hypothetical protein